MKLHRSVISSLVLFSVSGAVATAQQEQPQQVEMRDAATHEQLSRSLMKVQQEDPMKGMKSLPVTEDPVAASRPRDILQDSDFICFAGHATLVPKRAILQVPKNIADRLKLQPHVRFQSWPEFYAANRGWITTVEVTRAQAQGKEIIPEDTRKQLVKSGNLVVAVLQNGPISILPPVVVEAEQNASQPVKR